MFQRFYFGSRKEVICAYRLYYVMKKGDNICSDWSNSGFLRYDFKKAENVFIKYKLIFYICAPCSFWDHHFLNFCHYEIYRQDCFYKLKKTLT